MVEFGTVGGIEMEFKCQECKQVFDSEVKAKEHSATNKGHNKFDFKAIGVIKNIEG